MAFVRARRYVRAMKHEPGIFERSDPEAIAAADAQAEADIRAGRVHSHAIVGEWSMTWGKPGRLPFKDWLAQRNG